MINYHIVFCPRYRRKIFLIPGVEETFKQVTADICEQNDFEILAMECHIDQEISTEAVVTDDAVSQNSEKTELYIFAERIIKDDPYCLIDPAVAI